VKYITSKEIKHRIKTEDYVFFIFMRFCVHLEERRNQLDFKINLGYFCEDLLFKLYIILLIDVLKFNTLRNRVFWVVGLWV
jgi:hypothetical protein